MIQKDKKFVPVMLMPFQEDGSIDYNTLDNLVDFYLEAGAGGLFANCLSSEMYQLSQEERLESVSFIVKKVNGRVPIVATGTFEDTIENQAEFVKAMYATGVDAVIVITGLLAKEDDSEETFRANVEKLLALTDDVPLGFYECPVPYKRVLSADFLGQLVKTGRIKYHKDTSLDINSVRAKIVATKDDESFGLYDAYMAHAVETLKAGSAGLSCIQGNYFPEMVVWLCDNFDNLEKKDEVDQVQQFLIDNMDVMHDTYPVSAKYVLQKRGIAIGTFSRTPSKLPDENAKKQLDILLEDYQVLSEKIGVLAS
ncbi:dihydrodipicolinate synthase family protein [Parapedobacter sp. SGR-10]|uniref:dihydrodipicolinate synthase family protein n=1 Tax=Parapedobacter sp. SGR-10 TaxID=2710879 RepID=UPI0013D0757F|nr:dihydrodipicolinate synthase family protein [Parapedobacter sp. SGR-10]NGF56728.1 dihydrodipicolinate synthase family protein [Parapedobacter sp. SGR-10]